MYLKRLVIFICVFVQFYEAVTETILIRGKGASFPYEVYKNWMPAYRAHRSGHVRLEITYDSIGSGSGKKAIFENVDIEYAGSDSVLSEQSVASYPDLVIFPVMAGAVMMSYNIPGLSRRLVLTLEQVVGIYNGTYTWWNDTTFATNNPGVTLPQHRIVVIARADKSGTTSLFTEGLAAVSPAWKASYGVFSKGLNSETELPYHWNPDVIHYYGQQNRGVSGLILSFKYSIGYLSVADALEANIESAIIINKAGNPVNASSASVQSAMDYFSLTNSNLTFSLANAASDDAYPIAGFTHIIMYRTKMSNCLSAKELVRYIHWVLFDEETRMTCDRLGMAPLSISMVQRVKTDILQNVFCKGQKVWDMVQSDITEENKRKETWIIPVSVTIPIVLLGIICLCVYIVIQYIKLQKLIDSDEWHIPIDDIVFFFDERNKSSYTSQIAERLSFVSNKPKIDQNDEDLLIRKILQWPGKYQGNQIGMRLVELKELKTLNRETKHHLLCMKRKIDHNNVVRFFGLTELDNFRYVIGDYCSKGQITNILKDDKFNLSIDFKCSLAGDIANGMQYLHSNEIIHGNLKSGVCLIDDRWQVKVCDWEYCKLFSLQAPTVSTLLTMHNASNQDLTANIVAFHQFWVSPELLRSDFRLSPTKDMDIYSFAIIVQEIFTREDPYVEHADHMTPTEVIRAIVLNHLRPEHDEDMPPHIRQLMEICWNDNPVSRPSFDQVLKLLKRANPLKKTVIDSMMATMEDYIGHLEERIEEQDAEVKVVNDKLETALSNLMPACIAKRISHGKSVHPMYFPSVAVALLDISLTLDSLEVLDPRDVISFINQLCSEVDTIAKKYPVFTESLRGSSQAFVYASDSPNTNQEDMCLSMVDLSLDVLSHENILKLFRSPHFELRFGVHTDAAVTGLSGTVTPMYVVFGKCADVAQALARSASNACLHVTRNVWKNIRDNIFIRGNLSGELTIKGKTFSTYTVTRLDLINGDENTRNENQSVTSVPEGYKVPAKIGEPSTSKDYRPADDSTVQNGQPRMAGEKSGFYVSSKISKKLRNKEFRNIGSHHTEVKHKEGGLTRSNVQSEYISENKRRKYKLNLNNVYPSN